MLFSRPEAAPTSWKGEGNRDMQERRKYTRYHPDLRVRYIYVRGMIALEENTQLKDISINGLRLYLSSVIKKGGIFLVEMKLPFMGMGTISAIAKVIWTKDIGKNAEAGVIFDWISNINKLAKYIQGLQLKAA